MVRKFLFPSILTLFFLLFSTPVYANCHNLPKIPFSISPTTGTASTNFTITIQWSQLSQDDFQKFDTIKLEIVAYENIAPVTTSRAVDSYYGRKHQDKILQISSFLVDPGDHTLKLHLLGNGYPQCPMESSTSSITITGTATGLNPGDVCNPELQNNPGYACPAGYPCTQRGEIYYCLAAKPLPSPPCLEFDDKGSCIRLNTALGNISTDPAKLVSFILQFLLFISGGIAVLLIISGGYRMMTSQGNPEQLQGARETITSAIVGLLFIIFSLVLLEIIGVDILRIPGFGK